MNNVIYVDTSNPDDVLLVQPVPTKRYKRLQPYAKRRGVQHFKLDERIGLNPLFRCWCGQHIEVNYFAEGRYDYEGMSQRMRDFYDTHDSCPAPEPKVNG